MQQITVTPPAEQAYEGRWDDATRHVQLISAEQLKAEQAEEAEKGEGEEGEAEDKPVTIVEGDEYVQR